MATQINLLDVAHANAEQLLAATNAEYKRINALADGPEKEQARKALNERGNALAYQPLAGTCCAPSIRPLNCKSNWSGSGSTTSTSRSPRAASAG